MTSSETTTPQQWLKANHGSFHEGTYVIGVNLQLVTPEVERLCPVCKSNRMVLWEEVYDPKPRWWKCERRSHEDSCVYACRADDFPTVSNVPELDGTYNLTGKSLQLTESHRACICGLRLFKASALDGSQWYYCPCGFAYPVIWRPAWRFTTKLIVKRANFLEALKWFQTRRGCPV